MSVDAIIHRIREEAEKEVRAIRAEESCDVSNIRTRAEQDADSAYNHRISEGQREIRQYIASQQSKTRIEANRTVREAKEEIINHCFSEVSGYLTSIRTQKEYPGLFQCLLKECAENLGHEDILVHVHPDDRPLAEHSILALNEEGYFLWLSDRDILTSGGVICERVSDLVSIDNTMETRFSRMEREMVIAASQILFQTGES